MVRKKKQAFMLTARKDVLEAEKVSTDDLLKLEGSTDLFVIPTPVTQELVRDKDKVKVIRKGGKEPRQFHTGEFVRYPAWVCRKVITTLHEKFPKVQILNQCIILMDGRVEEDYRDDVSRMIPFILLDLADKKDDDTVEYLLWVLACYWHQYAHGPRPEGSPVVHLKKDMGPLWIDKLVCPICNHRYEGEILQDKAGHPDREKTMTAFFKWLKDHAKTCQKPDMSAREAKKIAKAKQAQADAEAQAKALAYAAIVSTENKRIQDVALREIRNISDPVERVHMYEMIIHAQQSRLEASEKKREEVYRALSDAQYFEVLLEEVKKDIPVEPYEIRILRQKAQEAWDELSRLESIYNNTGLTDFQKIMLNAFPANIEKARKRAEQLQRKLEDAIEAAQNFD